MFFYICISIGINKKFKVIWGKNFKHNKPAIRFLDLSGTDIHPHLAIELGQGI